ncbi:MAG: NADPH-dependent F420 reductase, partial [Acidimicrobiaceae bacterium]
MRIGLLGGTGPAGSALGLRLASIGYEIVLGSRDAKKAQDVSHELIKKWPDYKLKISGGDNDLAAGCELVVIATPWDSAATVVNEHAQDLAGKIVVTMANALVRVGKEFQPLVPPRGSIAAHVQAEIPLSRVVAAFQHLPATELGRLGHEVDS